MCVCLLFECFFLFLLLRVAIKRQGVVDYHTYIRFSHVFFVVLFLMRVVRMRACVRVCVCCFLSSSAHVLSAAETTPSTHKAVSRP